MDYYHDPRGGTEGQVMQLIQALDRARYVPNMTLLRRSKYIEQNGFPCPVMLLGVSRIGSIRSVLKVLHFGFTLRRKNFRIVHCYFNDVSMIAPPLLRVFGIRVLVSRRDMGYWYEPRLLKALRLVSWFVDRYVANSQAVKRVVQQHEHVAAEKISVIYNGFVASPEKHSVAAEVFRRLGAIEGSPIIGMVANIRPIKRIDALIEAFAIVHGNFPLARLAIVGDYDSKQGEVVQERLAILANQLGVGDYVTFTGGVEDPMSYVSQFSVAVLCSESEGLSNSLIEYMQAGRPIVCTDTGGNPELIQDGFNGFLVPVGNANALADRLIDLLSNGSLAQRLGDAARESVLSTCSLSRMVNEQMACYDEVLKGNRSSRSLNGESGVARQ